jgi:hypothetical protein
MVPFVGAGVSIAVRRRGGNSAFPSWHRLLTHAAERLHAEDRSDIAASIEAMLDGASVDYFEVAKEAKSGLGSIWPRFLTEMFTVSKDDIDDASLALPRAVWALGSPLVITTNYDRVLDWACPRSYDLDRWSIESKSNMVKALKHQLDRPTLWQLHGSIDEPDSIILSPDGYQHLYADDEHERRHRAALHTLRSLIASRTVLFIGFSLEDRFVADQIKWAQEVLNGGPHYVLTREANLAAMRERLAGTDIQPIAFGDHGPPLIAKLNEIARIARPIQTQGPQVQAPARGYLVWEQVGETGAQRHVTHLVSAHNGDIRVTLAMRPGLFSASSTALWELRWSERTLIHQPIAGVFDDDFESPAPRPPEILKLSDADFLSTSGNTVGLFGDWGPFYWRTEGIDIFDRTYGICGSVASTFFVRSQDFILYHDGNHAFYGSTFTIIDLERCSTEQLSSYLSEAELARINTTEAEHADELFTNDLEHSGDTKTPGLTMFFPAYSDDGRLHMKYQFTRETFGANADGSWQDYMFSKLVTSDFLPVRLEAHRELPAPVLAWYRTRSGPSVPWGWSAVYDTHSDWCRALFGHSLLAENE